MRYIKQKDTYSCGPVALINALKWAGFKYTYKDLKRFQRLCKCTYPNGCSWNDFTSAIRSMSKLMTTTRKNWPGILDINNHLREGGIIVLSYRLDPLDNSHYLLIVDYDPAKKEYTVVNKDGGEKRAESKISWGDMAEILKHHYVVERRLESPSAWFLRFKIMRREAA